MELSDAYCRERKAANAYSLQNYTVLEVINGKVEHLTTLHMWLAFSPLKQTASVALLMFVHFIFAVQDVQ
jgi:hypothetical protein